MTRFRQALLDELLSRVDDRVADPAERPAPVPRAYQRLRPSRPRLAVAGAALAAAATATAVMATQLGGAPAYAVTVNPDGTITITANDLADPETANRELRAAGAANVIILPDRWWRCRPVVPRPPHQNNKSIPRFNVDDLERMVAESRRDNVVVVRPDLIPDGLALMLTPSREPEKDDLVVKWGLVQWDPTEPPLLTCVPGQPASPR